MQPISELQSIVPLAGSSSVWFVDIWGVMHNGVRPYVSACTACIRFRQSGGTVILVSNAPRPNADVIAQLDKIGVDRSAYDAVVTSGDLSRKLIARWAGRPILHIGPERDRPIFDGTDVLLDTDPTAVEAIACTGLYDDETETPENYGRLLRQLEAKRLPMICANPDLKVMRGGRTIYCAGAIAAAYAQIGGSVSYAGKPHLPIYDMALATARDLRSEAIDKAQILAIGDGIATDIDGATAFGIRSVFIASGLYETAGEGLATTASRLFPVEMASRPVAIMRELA